MSCYVYEHWRPDTDTCFYVGKGSGRRAFRSDGRNEYHKRVQSVLARQCLTFEVRFIATELTEIEAFTIEKARIKFWRDRGAKLANFTDGGEGRLGYKLSDETKKRIGDVHRNKPKSVEHRAKMSASHAGHVVSAETREKLRQAHQGRRHTPEAIARMSKIQRKIVKSPEELARIAALGRAMKGVKRPQSEATKAKISKAHKGRKLTVKHRRALSRGQRRRQKLARRAKLGT